MARACDQEWRKRDRRSALADRAKEARPLLIPAHSNRRATTSARLARPPINQAVELEVARLAVTADKIAQAATASFDCVSQRLTDRIDQQGTPWSGKTAGRCGRPDSRSKKAFGRVDVTDAHDRGPRKQQLFDRQFSPTGCGVQVSGIESL